jgi:uncharacterized protein (TIGR02270 family)
LSIGIVIAQHCEDATHLSGVRTAQVMAPHVRLHHLARLDERLAAHLDGLLIAEEAGWRLCEAGLESMSSEVLFVATVMALETRHPDRLERLLAVAQAIPEARGGLFAAFGWSPATRLQGTVMALLSAADPFQRVLGVAACGMHRVDPGLSSASRLEDADPAVRARAWRTAGELGRLELVSTAAAAAADEDPACAFWAAWSAVLLGDRHNALEALAGIANVSGPLRERAFSLATQAMSVAQARHFLQANSHSPQDLRRLIRGTGLAGDPADIPWLIDLMANDSLTRVAGESFSLVTGTDLARLDLERKPSLTLESGPNDDPDDSDVEMDDDCGLPWPDPARVQAWWATNSSRFHSGVRYFMGEPLNAEICLKVLRAGYQRQRIAAATYLSLLNPGTSLFEWRAPAHRQQRLLAS